MCRCNPMLDGSESWHRVFAVQYWDKDADDGREDLSGTQAEGQDAFNRIVAQGHHNVVLNERMYRRIDCSFESFEGDKPAIPMVEHDIAVLEGFHISLVTPSLGKRRTLNVKKGSSRVRISLAEMRWTHIEHMDAQDIVALCRLIEAHHEALMRRAEAMASRQPTRPLRVVDREPS